MRGLIARVAAILRAMPRFVMEQVREAGRMVWRLVAKAPPAEPAPSIDLREHTDVEEEDRQIRHVAGVLVQGRELKPDDIKGMPEVTVKWLQRLDRSALVKILATDKEQLRAHTRGRALIKGVERHATKPSVEDAQIEAMQPGPGGEQRTLRDVLAERGVAI